MIYEIALEALGETDKPGRKKALPLDETTWKWGPMLITRPFLVAIIGRPRIC